MAVSFKMDETKWLASRNRFNDQGWGKKVEVGYCAYAEKQASIFALLARAAKRNYELMGVVPVLVP